MNRTSQQIAELMSPSSPTSTSTAPSTAPPTALSSPPASSPLTPVEGADSPAVSTQTNGSRAADSLGRDGGARGRKISRRHAVSNSVSLNQPHGGLTE